MLPASTQSSGAARRSVQAEVPQHLAPARSLTFAGVRYVSIDALNWAISLELKPSSSKFVLLALADVAQESNLAFPSLERIERFTSLNRKTVISALDDLIEKGVIVDTGKRVGRTSQVKVYELVRTSLKYVPCICTDPKTEPFDAKNGTLQHQKRDGSENGTLPTIPAAPGARRARALGKLSAASSGEISIARGVLDYLNKVAGARFMATPTNLAFIVDRLAEGYTPHVLKLVAFHRLTRWRQDPKMLEYMRPATLYNGEKCNQYAGQVPAAYFKTCSTCSSEILPDAAGGCPNGCTARAEAAAEAARQPMPDHIRRLEGESVKQWIDRLKEAGKVAA